MSHRRRSPSAAATPTAAPKDRDELIRLAYREAAALLRVDMDAASFDETFYTDEEEHFVREFIREDIVALLERKGGLR